MSTPNEIEDILAQGPGRARDMVVLAESLYRDASIPPKDGYEVALLVSTNFGVHRVDSMFAMGSNIIGVVIVGDGSRHAVFTPVEQCSFMIRDYELKDETLRRVVGFAPPPKHAA